MIFDPSIVLENCDLLAFGLLITLKYTVDTCAIGLTFGLVVALLQLTPLPPTSALDPELVGEVLAAIRQLAAEGMTMVIVTHEIGLAFELADRVIFMDQGIVAASGDPRELLLSDANPRLAAFVGRFTEQARLLSPLVGSTVSPTYLQAKDNRSCPT
ncbi:amino acid ABC transporter ATP-binding protein [Rhizobium etli]|uniref:amino acid ABC transporter ATP-binding protein n=1 Tax=Rhizobium etli TaxID=29449 RepID=UPI0003839F02|nr:P-loop NTPase domain-containing protein [Rhizobium etli bv. mimosae str. Mim1]